MEKENPQIDKLYDELSDQIETETKKGSKNEVCDGTDVIDSKNNNLKVKTETNKLETADQIIESIAPDTEKHLLPQILKEQLLPELAKLESPESNFYLKHKVKDYFGLTNEDLNNLKEVITSLRTELAVKAQTEEPEEEPLTPDERKEAEKLLDSPVLLYDVLQTIKKLGVVGEEQKILLVYCALTSRITANPLSVTVKGESSGGKSFIIKKTMPMFPKSAYRDITEATTQSFYYVDKDYCKHRIIIVFEKHGAKRSDYAIRTLQSEEKLIIQVTERDSETGKLGTSVREVEGPVGFITTTTSPHIHPENETRNLSLYVDESVKQTRGIVERLNQEYSSEIMEEPESFLANWINLQRVLKNYKVTIPFASAISAKLPFHITRIRRDYQKILALIEVVALLHQRQRKVNEEKNILWATTADYYIVKILFEKIIAKTIQELPTKTVELINVAKGLDDGFTRQDMGKNLGWDKSTVTKWVEPAENKNFLIITEKSKGNQPHRYIVNQEKEVQDESILPSVDEIIENSKDMKPEIAKICFSEKVYNPLTGEICCYASMQKDPPKFGIPQNLGVSQHNSIATNVSEGIDVAKVPF